MAPRMIPPWPDPGTKSQAEKDLFSLLQDQLSDKWTVLHNVSFRDPDPSKHKDCEADFIIAHPDLGILLMEVKGGFYFRDEEEKVYICKTQDKRIAAISGFTQALDNKYALERYLNSKASWPNMKITNYAVAYPDSLITHDLGPNATRPQIIDGTDLKRLEKEITRILKISAYRTNDQGTSWMDALVQLLKEVIRLIKHPIRKDDTDPSQEEMLNLEEDQYDILVNLKEIRRATISGQAGSGKTVLALEKARQLHEDENLSVLYVCYNTRIAEAIKSLNKGFDVFRYHELCEHYARKAGIVLNKPPGNASIASLHKYYRCQLPAALFKAGEELPKQPYDAIIIDDAQDFIEQEFNSIEILLNKNQDVQALYIFLDEHQQVFSQFTPDMLPQTGKPFHLAANIRNPEPVFNLVKKFYGGTSDLRCKRGDGPPCVVKTYSSSEKMFDQIGKAIYYFQKDLHIDLKDIVVLTPRQTSPTSDLRGPLSGLMDQKAGNYHLVKNPGKLKKAVDIASIYAYKGLESKAVILCELDKEIEEKPLRLLLYTMVSRATFNLTILMKDTLWPGISEDLKKG